MATIRRTRQHSLASMPPIASVMPTTVPKKPSIGDGPDDDPHQAVAVVSPAAVLIREVLQVRVSESADPALDQLQGIADPPAQVGPAEAAICPPAHRATQLALLTGWPCDWSGSRSLAERRLLAEQTRKL